MHPTGSKIFTAYGQSVLNMTENCSEQKYRKQMATIDPIMNTPLPVLSKTENCSGVNLLRLMPLQAWIGPFWVEFILID